MPPQAATPYRRSWINRLFYRFARYTCRMLVVLLYRYRFSGLEHLPRRGGALVLANHQSFLDPVLLGVPTLRRIHYLARVTLYRSRLFRLLTAPLDAVPLDRKRHLLSGLREAIGRMQGGEVLGIFPEGQRTWDGQLLPLQPGFLLLARRAGVPLVPVGIAGAYEVWPRQRRWPGLGRIWVHYGEPIPPEQVAAMSDQELMNEVARRIAHCFQHAQRKLARLEPAPRAIDSSPHEHHDPLARPRTGSAG